jgi:uncharacterized protein with GYD domain
MVGQSVTFTATISGNSGTPTGTVTFMDDSTQLGTATLDANGVATLTTSALSAGSHNITANYSGDGTYDTSSATLTQTVLDTSNTTLMSSLNPSTFGQSINLTASVSGNSGTPTGTVTFQDGGNTLGTATLDATGNASISTNALAVGSHTITANYSGDSTYTTSSANLTQTVNQAASNTSITSSLNPSEEGQIVTFTAHVSSPQGGSPTGNVTFYDYTGLLTIVMGTVTLDASGNASLSTSALSAGSHTISATYNGDANYTSSSAALTQTVNPTPPPQANDSVSLTSSLNPAAVGQNITLTTTVSGMYGTPTGIVTFRDSTTHTDLATVTLDANGNASFSTAALTIGNHDITAYYSGDSTYDPNGASLTQTINGNATTTTLASSLNPAQPGQDVSFSAAVTASSGTPTGSIAFLDGSTTLGTVALDNSGHASFDISTLSLGNHTITANYSGDATYAASNANLTQVIGQATTRLTLASSANPAVPGQSVIFTAALSTPAGTPTGTVTFKDGSTVLGTATLTTVNGQFQATFTTSSLALGDHAITASYDGDATHTGSSGALTQTVQQGNSSTSLSSSANASQPSQPVTLTAVVSASAGNGAPAPTGSVTFLDGHIVLGSAAVSRVNGQYQATLTTSTLTLGDHFLTAIYSGDNAYDGSSASLTQTVAPASTSLALNSDANPAQSGQSVTFMAQLLAPVGQGAPTPTGTVTFLNGTTLLGSAAISLVGGMYQASVTTSLADGSSTITAIYNGDSDYTGSSATLEQVVGSSSLVGSSVVLSSSASPALPGQAVTFTATVNGFGSAPTGTVVLLDGTSSLGSAALSLVNGQAQATITTSSLSLGTHNITAIYLGDGTYAGSGVSRTQTISLASTSMSLSSSANPLSSGDGVTWTATVASTLATPSGNVSFYDGSTLLGTASLVMVNGQAQASFTSAALGVGSHTIVALYSGDSTCNTSGAALQQTVN